MSTMYSSSRFTKSQLRRTTLAIGLGMGLGLMGTGAIAQSAAGAIFGQVGSTENSTIVIQNVDTGLSRTVPVDSSGRYRAAQLPTGRYKVTLQQNGNTVSTRDDVVVSISGGTEVSFNAGSAAAKNLEGVVVSASALPSIDVSSVDTRTVFSAEQLAKLPVTRDVSAAALLAPSVVTNTAYGVPSFGGSASSENAYYINGYAVTNPLTSIGFSTLPHNDKLEDLVRDQPIALLSLGATREMVIRAKRPPRRVLHLDLEAGSLLLMDYSSQFHYDHGIPKQRAPMGPRISLAFRVRPPAS
jgi:hypothetical protein